MCCGNSDITIVFTKYIIFLKFIKSIFNDTLFINILCSIHTGAARAMHDVNAVVSTARDEMQSSRLVSLDNASIDKRHQISMNNMVDNERVCTALHIKLHMKLNNTTYNYV